METKEMNVGEVYVFDGLRIEVTYNYEQGASEIVVQATEGDLLIRPGEKNEVSVFSSTY